MHEVRVSLSCELLGSLATVLIFRLVSIKLPPEPVFQKVVRHRQTDRQTDGQADRRTEHNFIITDDKRNVFSNFRKEDSVNQLTKYAFLTF